MKIIHLHKFNLNDIDIELRFFTDDMPNIFPDIWLKVSSIKPHYFVNFNLALGKGSSLYNSNFYITHIPQFNLKVQEYIINYSQKYLKLIALS